MWRVRGFALFIALAAAHASAEIHFVSPDGDDHHPGTYTAPLRTISAAAERAQPGDTVYVREGVYRERVAPARGGEPGKPIRYLAEPGKRVVVKGSVVWRPEWRAEGDGLYSAHPDDALFDDRGAEYVDSYNPLKAKLASTPWNRNGKREIERGFSGNPRLEYTCGQLFVDGRLFKESPLKEELAPRGWWYDANQERVYVHFAGKEPKECLVELTVRRRIFAPRERGLGHLVVEGFVFEHCGNQYPTNFWEEPANAQRGAVGAEAGHHWVFRHNVFRYAKTFGLDVGNVDHHNDKDAVRDNLVEENYFIDNGSAGVMSCGSRNLVIRGNVVLRNNQLHFAGSKRWEQAGIKCHSFSNGLIENNYIASNPDNYGVWLDNRFPVARIAGNVIRDNGRAGVFLEMSDYAFDALRVEGNWVFDNHENAVYIHDASGATFTGNLLANTRAAKGFGQAVYIRQVRSRTKTYHHSFYGNLLIGNASNVEVNYPAFRSGPQRFDGNLYDVGPDRPAFVVNAASEVPSPWSDKQFRALFKRDLRGAKRPDAAFATPKKAALDFAQWQTFWARHGEPNDQHSRCVPGNEVAYDPATHVLNIRLECDPPAYEAPNAGDADSPFAGLRRGENRVKIWDGLPIVPAGELPPASWTRN